MLLNSNLNTSYGLESTSQDASVSPPVVSFDICVTRDLHKPGVTLTLSELLGFCFPRAAWKKKRKWLLTKKIQISEKH